MGSAGYTPQTVGTLRWGLALGGLGLGVLAILALSGPGRIDIVDGQARYLVARSLLENGDPAVGDPDFWFSVLPGRDGNRYSTYRFPHSVLGVPAIALADATGLVSDSRRQFFFSLVGSFLGAVLVVFYAVWFRGLGWSPGAAAAWALAGIFCTPVWFYATSTFDDLIGTVFIVAAVVVAWQGRQNRPLASATLAGLALGLAINAKQPLGIFFLPTVAIVLTADQPLRVRLGAAVLSLLGVGIGLAAYQGYEWYKFPPGTTDDHARLLSIYLGPWPGNTPAGLAGLLLSPAAGMFWYCPPLVLGLAGLARWRAHAFWFCASLGVAAIVFTAFISTMTFFKGDPCWGPRYLTPVFGLFWLFAPTAARAWPPRLTALLLGSGFLVQVFGLSVDPHRLYVYHRLPSSFYAGREWIHFHPALSHLANRPREIVEILRDDGSHTTEFSPAPELTAAPPVLERIEGGTEAVRRYRILASFRPWWVSHHWLAPEDRPVPLAATALGFLALAAAGLALVRFGLPTDRSAIAPTLQEQRS
jgi:hypothetical protein